MRTLLPRLLAAVLALSLLHSYTTVSLCAEIRAEAALNMASIYAAGDVRVNGRSALTGGTIFSDSTVDTGHASRAVIRLNKTGNIELVEETRLKISFNDSGIIGALHQGRVRVSVAAGMVTSITASDVTLLADSNEAALFSVKIEENVVTVSVEAGQLKIIRGTDTQLITAGNLFSTASESQSQQAARQNLSRREKVGFALGIGGAIALIAFLLTGQSEDKAPTEPCVVILSGEVRCP